MSDDDALGEGCCVHRRIYVGIVAAFFFLYGVYHALYFTLYSYVHMATLTPNHCAGAGCDDILSCAGTRAASYHFRVCVLSIGSLVFGVIGCNSVFNKYPEDMLQFTWWTLFVAFVFFSVWVMDGVYMVLCGNQYSYNTIMEAVLWPIYNLPFSEGIKYEIRTLDEYPRKYVDGLAYGSVWRMFSALYFIRVIFFLVMAFQAFILAQRFHYGLAGMGANFSIESWRKRLMMRNELDEVAYNTFDMAWATGMDAGWTEDEFSLRKPLRRPHWYRGNAPAAAAFAYDGFQDDRRNVLL